MRQDAAVPQRAAVARVAAALLGELGRGPVGVVADRFHRAVGELDRRLATRTACAAGSSASWKPMMPRPTGRWRRFESRAFVDRVVVDVDDVVEHAHRGARPSCLQLGLVELAVRAGAAARLTEPRLQTAISSSLVLSVISVHRFDVHDADVLLRRAHVAGVLERDPRMPGLEQHRQHLAPQVCAAGIFLKSLISPRAALSS